MPPQGSPRYRKVDRIWRQMYRRRKRTQPPLIAAIEKVPVDWLLAILERMFLRWILKEAVVGVHLLGQQRMLTRYGTGGVDLSRNDHIHF